MTDGREEVDQYIVRARQAAENNTPPSERLSVQLYITKKMCLNR